MALIHSLILVVFFIREVRIKFRQIRLYCIKVYIKNDKFISRQKKKKKKWNEMKWNGMKWNKMKWNEMIWNEKKLNEIIWNEMKW